MKQTVLSALIRGFPLALIAAGLALFVIWGGGGDDEAQAVHSPGAGDVVVGFDMDTANTGTAPNAEGQEDGVGQACNDGLDNGGGDGIDGADTDCQSLGNASTSLGPIDVCVDNVVAGDILTFDVFIDGIPAAAPDLAGFGYSIQFPEAAGAVIATQAHATSGTTILQPNIPLSEAVPDPPGASGGPVGEHIVSEAVFGPPPTAGPEVGVLGRYTLDTAGMAAGAYTLSFVPGSLAFGNSAQPPGDWTPQITDTLDGAFAVGQACPTLTDVEVTSVTTAAPGTDQPVNTAFAVTADVALRNNPGGLDPVNVDTTIELSLPSDCTIVAGGDPNPVFVEDTSVSVAASPLSLTQRSWQVECSSPSFHTFTTTATAVIDDAAIESDPTNNALTSAASSPQTPVIGSTDVEVTTVTAGGPASATTGVAFAVTGDVALSNLSGIDPASVDTTVTLNLPIDCSTGSTNPVTVQNTSVTQAGSPVSLAQRVWSVTCTNRSAHSFTVDADAVLDQLHATDSVPGNDSATSAAANVELFDETDVEVTTVTVTVPASDQAVNTAFDVTADVDLSNLSGVDPANVDTSITLGLPSDCTTGDTNPVTLQDTAVSQAGSPVSLAQQSWSVTCTEPSSHAFTVDASTTIDELHVADSDNTNDSGSGQDSVAVTGQADVEVVDVSLTVPASVGAGTAFNAAVSATLVNNGPFEPVNADVTVTLALPRDCTSNPSGAQVAQDISLAAATETGIPVLTWSVTCSGSGSRDFSAEVVVAIDQLHLSDTDTANDSSNSAVLPVVVNPAGATPTATPSPTGFGPLGGQGPSGGDEGIATFAAGAAILALIGAASIYGWRRRLLNQRGMGKQD